MREQIYRTEEDRIQRMKDRRALIWRMEEEAALRRKSDLSIAASDDAFEQHADAVANKVVAGEDASGLVKNQPSADNSLQTKSESDTPAITDQFQSSLSSSKGGGQHLDATTQNEMGSKMGSDLSDVKVHTDSIAHEMSESINAKAFTHGSDIYFKQGNYDTSSTEGKSLLAHELTHTVQQSSGLSRKIMRAQGEDLLGQTKNVENVSGKTNDLVDQLAVNPKSYKGRKAQKDKKNFEPDLENKLKRKLAQYAAAGKSSVTDPDLENIANSAAKQMLAWMGNYQGVNVQNVVFKTASSLKDGANLKSFDEQTKPYDFDVLQYKIAQYGSYISPEYSGVKPNFDFSTSSPFTDAVTKATEALLPDPNIIHFAEAFAGLTSERGEMALRRIPYSNADVIERNIEGYPINIDQLTILANAVEELSTSGPLKDTYLDLLEFLDSEHRRRVYARTTGAQSDAKEREEFAITNKKSLDADNVVVGASELKADTGVGEGRVFDSIFNLLILNPDSLDNIALTAAVKTAFSTAVESTIQTSNTEFMSIPASQGAKVRSISKRELMQRYGIFTTALHEFLHYVVHPNFKFQNDQANSGNVEKQQILEEGMQDLFVMDVWNDLKSKLTGHGEDILDLRSKIEGWSGARKEDYTFKAPDLKLSDLPVYHVYDQTYAANELKNVVGMNTLKAAYFLGHAELLGLGEGDVYKDYTKERKGYETLRDKNQTPSTEPYLLPQGKESMGEFTNTLYQVAFEKGMYTLLEGKDADDAWLMKISLIKAEQDKVKSKKKKEKLGAEVERLTSYETASNAASSTKENFGKSKINAELMKPVVDAKNDTVQQLQSEYDAELAILNIKQVNYDNFPKLNDREFMENEIKQQQLVVDSAYQKLEQARTGYDKINAQYQQLVGADTQKAWAAYMKAKDDLQTESDKPQMERNYYHDDKKAGGTTYVLRDPGHVIALSDVTLQKLANENKIKLEKNIWSTWFKKIEKFGFPKKADSQTGEYSNPEKGSKVLKVRK
ncbi:MAG: DUF4157 domain-containing protein [Bacteroidia bacterium]